MKNKLDVLNVANVFKRNAIKTRQNHFSIILRLNHVCPNLHIDSSKYSYKQIHCSLDGVFKE